MGDIGGKELCNVVITMFPEKILNWQKGIQPISKYSNQFDTEFDIENTASVTVQITTPRDIIWICLHVVICGRTALEYQIGFGIWNC